MNTRKLLISLLAPIAMSVACAASAKDIYVSTSGNNGNAGSAENAPLRTIAAAASKAAAGDTVLLMSGRYSEPIVPARSGEKGRPITFRSHGKEPAVITGSTTQSESSAIYIAGKSDIIIDGIHVDGGKVPPKAALNHFMTVKDSSRITVRNSTFRNANGWHGIGIRGSSYVTLEDSTIDMVGEHDARPDDTSGGAEGDAIEVRGKNSHILIQRNRMTHGGHNLLRMDATDSVIQDNYFDNNWSDQVGGDAGYRNVTLIGARNVFQRNYLTGTRFGPNGRLAPLMKVEGVENIVRHNVFTNGVAEGIGSEAGSWTVNGKGCRIYHNTFYRLGGGAWMVRVYAGYSLTDFDFRNNLVIDSRLSPKNANLDAEASLFVAAGGGGATAGSVIAGNLFAPGSGKEPVIFSDAGGGAMPLSQAESRHPSLILANRAGAPQFVSASLTKLADFVLQQGSQGVDQGLFLTTATASGSSTRLPVADTRSFTDGYGLVPGDVIQLEGSSTRATVVKVDAAGKALELSQALQFAKGQGVALRFDGSAPDVGAHESGRATIRTPGPPRAVYLE